MMLTRRASMNTARTSPRKLMIAWLGLGAICLLVSASAHASDPLTSPTEFDTLVPGWEYKFSLNWKVEPSKNGTNIVWGRVQSHYGVFASGFPLPSVALLRPGTLIPP